MNDGVSDICSRYKGETLMCFYLTDIKKTIMHKNKLGITVNEESYKALSEAFGAENIGLIQ